jgi:bifunctional DNA-binding transcriptional regulator/antitoxin component of YhaV-PrlF toxin-antitoxin module
VQTSRRAVHSTGHFAIQLATAGGNQSWSGTVKKFDPDTVDYLFVLVEDGRMWFIPSHEIEGRRCIHLGGPKYSEFGVGQLAPFDHADLGPSKLVNPRGGAGVGEPGRTVNPMALPEWVRFPPPPPPPPPGGDSLSQSGETAIGRTRMSKNHQVTVPLAVAAASSIEPGDRFRVESDGTGRFVMTRIEEYLERLVDQLAIARQPND